MRLICGILCLLLGLGMISCQVEGPREQGIGDGAQRHAAEWVRTVDGWERVDTWYAVEVHPPQLHPLVVAAGVGLLSLLGLAAGGGQGIVVEKVAAD